MKTYAEQVDVGEGVHPEEHLYPYCVVWTPIPVVSYLCPWIGHTGVGSSQGKIHDFSGSYTVSVDDMLFGWPKKYARVSVEGETKAKWDEALELVDSKFREKVHNLVQNNCHSHVAELLNDLGYEGKSWSTLSIWWLLVTRSRYVSYSAVVVTYLPFLLILLLFYILSP